MKKLTKYFFSTKNKAIIALGSNLGNKFNNISVATDLLRKANKVIKTYQLYLTTSYNTNNQILPEENSFFNAAVQIETDLKCEDLFQYCKAIERVHIYINLLAIR